MKSLFLNTLYIFDFRSKLAKKVEFNRGINVITSDKVNGNDVGKSVLLKSIYHTLGADSIFDNMWEASPKTYLVNISVNEVIYYVYRSANLFKIYDEQYKMIFSTINREELSMYFGDLYGFIVKLPNRQEDELEITPPVFSYILNYVDQDHMNGTNFSSFRNLGQYASYKENVIYNHFGVFNDEFFDLTKKLEAFKRNEKKLRDEKQIIENMLGRIQKYLEGLDAPIALSSLNIELDRKKDEYLDIVTKLKKVKNSLVNIRNTKLDLEMDIKDLQSKHNEESKIFNNVSHKCPRCCQEVDELLLRIEISGRLEDYIIMKDDLDRMLSEVKRKIKIKEKEYNDILRLLESYQENLKINELKVSDSLKHMGYLETQENLFQELGQVNYLFEQNKNDIKTHNNKLKKFLELKRVANSLYEKYMTESKDKFGLEEIGYNKIKNITQNYEARGSNKAISTIIWYFNLLKIKNELNEDVIKFPLVLDSPNNVESDEIKEKALFEYIFSNINKNTQLIVSTLGFKKEDYEKAKIDKIIELTNDKYHVLNSLEYEENKAILDLLFDNNVT